MEVSAKDSINVDNAFLALAKKLCDQKYAIFNYCVGLMEL